MRISDWSSECALPISQHRNRAMAMDMLRARMYERELQAREDAAQAEHAARTDIGWGHQIRSYVLQPYELVKDLRTGRSEEHTSELQSLMRISYAVFCLQNKRPTRHRTSELY